MTRDPGVRTKGKKSTTNPGIRTRREKIKGRGREGRENRCNNKIFKYSLETG